MAWKHRILTEQEMKELVRDVYDGKIFTSLQCGDHVGSSFMISLFLGCGPSEDTHSDPVIRKRNNRKAKLKYIEEREDREAFLNSIGMFYEYMDKAGPMYVNGRPTFFSCHILSIDETKRFIEVYNKYVEARKQFEEEWK